MSRAPIEAIVLSSDVSDALPGLPHVRASAETRRFEIPTLLVAVAVYGGFALTTWFFRDLPMLLAAPLLAVLLAWYGSLQHETIHGHPTSSRGVNLMLARLPLTLWIPYDIYRSTHLQHHRHGGRHLTEVFRDPESFYLPAGTLRRAGALTRALHSINCTLAGRLILGPCISIARFWLSEARLMWRGDRGRVIIWTRHVPAVAVVLVWIVGVCHIPFLVYAAFVVYPSVALAHLRSFAEHRADAESHLRTAAVEAGPLWALIFLNNNLHIAHHAYPKLAWYELPHAWRHMRDAAVASGRVFRGGYGEVFRQYLFRPVISVEHPAPGRGDA